MRKLLCAIMLSFVLAVPALAGDKPIEMKWAQPEPAGHPWTDIGEEICKEIDKRSNGRIKITQYPAGQLGSHLELVEMLRTGSVALHTSGPAALNAFDERVQIFNMPYLIKSKEQAYRIFESEVGQKMFNDVILKRSGIRTLQFWYFGTRTLTLNRSAMKPEDLAGAKVRCMEMPIFKDAIASLGANPTPITFSELYMALQTKVVDGQENPIPTIYAQKFYEVQPYVILTNHTVHMGTVHISEMVWKRLAKEDQDLIMAVFDEFRPKIDSAIEKDAVEKLEVMKKGGVTVVEPDYEAFKKHSLDYMMERYGKKWGDLIKAFNEIE